MYVYSKQGLLTLKEKKKYILHKKKEYPALFFFVKELPCMST